LSSRSLRRALASFWLGIGIICSAVLLALPAVVTALSLVSLSYLGAVAVAVWLLVLVLPFVAFGVAARVRRGAARVRAARAAEAEEMDPSRPPVLLLRAFDDDGLKVGVIDNLLDTQPVTLEEILVAEFSKVGPVITVGRPGELAPPVGASRLWIRDEHWQEVVDRLIAECQLIVMVLGAIEDHEGLAWEAARLVSAGALEKMVLVIPPLPDEEAGRRWIGYRRAMGGKLPGFQTGALYVRMLSESRCQVIVDPAGTTPEDRRPKKSRGDKWWQVIVALARALAAVQAGVVLPDYRPVAERALWTYKGKVLVEQC
jgi:hypothetical protein